jgi:3-phytase
LGGLRLYDLDGHQIGFVQDGRHNNVDVRYQFTLAGKKVDIVASSNIVTNNINVWTIDAEQRNLIKVGSIPTSLEIYGIGLYQNLMTDKFYVLASSRTGKVQQFELFDQGAGQIGGSLLRTLHLDSQVEGIVADDELGAVYIGEEAVGLWRYDADPTAGAQRTLVDGTGPGGHLTEDVEGLAIYRTQGGQGYLLASSQGNNRLGSPASPTMPKMGRRPQSKPMAGARTGPKSFSWPSKAWATPGQAGSPPLSSWENPPRTSRPTR